MPRANGCFHATQSHINSVIDSSFSTEQRPDAGHAAALCRHPKCSPSIVVHSLSIAIVCAQCFDDSDISAHCRNVKRRFALVVCSDRIGSAIEQHVDKVPIATKTSQLQRRPAPERPRLQVRLTVQQLGDKAQLLALHRTMQWSVARSCMRRLKITAAVQKHSHSIDPTSLARRMDRSANHTVHFSNIRIMLQQHFHAIQTSHSSRNMQRRMTL
mmetsp:Transcript_13314/g.29588  ORF Transcript_13314/g.29588 Transcript_13314/m.29588 type:complete len:214 (+) Transcript_13314:426-1067(+)